MMNENAHRTNAHRREIVVPPATLDASTPPAKGETNAGNDLRLKESSSGVVVKFGSAENEVAAEVAADIKECERINGAEDLFGSTELKVRDKFMSAYKPFRRATSDTAYCAELVKQLNKESGGAYTPSSKKPWCLAAFLALKPRTKAHEKQTYDAAYFFRHAAIADISLDGFPGWIEGRNLKASIAFVRSRKGKGKPKPNLYPNIAKAKKLKKHAAAAKILKDANDKAEEELQKLFDREALGAVSLA